MNLWKIGKNSVSTFYNEKIKNATVKSDVKNLVSKFKAMVVDILKNLQKDLVKEAKSTGKDIIKEEKKEKTKESLRPGLKMKKNIERNLKKQIDLTPTKETSKSIINGSKGSVGKELSSQIKGR